jgi:serine/threonine protein kinase
VDEELLQEVEKEIKKVSPQLITSPVAQGGRYGVWQIQQLLGRNSIGELFLVRRADEGEAAAVLRSFDSSLSRNPRLVKRFLQEAEKAAAVNHPFIAKVLDFGRTEDGTAYMVRTYIAGQTLQEILKNGPIECHRAIDILIAVCSAIAEAGKNGLLHRNLNPSNILIKEDGSVSVVDFGVSKSVPSEGRQTQGLTLYQGRHDDMRYASPEQVKDDRLDIKADIYSLGCIMHLVFSGKAIFADRDGFRLLKSKIQGEIDASVFESLVFNGSSEERAKAIERISYIVLRSVSGDKSWRYDSPDELADDLKRVKAGKDVRSSTRSAVREIEKKPGWNSSLGKSAEVSATATGEIAVAVDKNDSKNFAAAAGDKAISAPAGKQPLLPPLTPFKRKSEDIAVALLVVVLLASIAHAGIVWLEHSLGREKGASGETTDAHTVNTTATEVDSNAPAVNTTAP